MGNETTLESCPYNPQEPSLFWIFLHLFKGRLETSKLLVVQSYNLQNVLLLSMPTLWFNQEGATGVLPLKRASDDQKLYISHLFFLENFWHFWTPFSVCHQGKPSCDGEWVERKGPAQSHPRGQEQGKKKPPMHWVYANAIG